MSIGALHMFRRLWRIATCLSRPVSCLMFALMTIVSPLAFSQAFSLWPSALPTPGPGLRHPLYRGPCCSCLGRCIYSVVMYQFIVPIDMCHGHWCCPIQ